MIFDEEILSAKVLIIDDQKVNARLLEEILRKSGYKNITCIYDARDAQTVYAALKPHAVVLDLNMPNMDGLELTRKIRGDARFKSLPILMLTGMREQTGFSFPGKDKDSQFLPVDDFAEKPIKPQDLLARVGKLLEKGKGEWKKTKGEAMPVITAEDIALIVSKWTGIPLVRLEEKETERLLKMEEALHKRIVGQERVIELLLISLFARGHGLFVGVPVVLGRNGIEKIIVEVEPVCFSAFLKI